jgi:hypothetical protein
LTALFISRVRPVRRAQNIAVSFVGDPEKDISYRAVSFGHRELAITDGARVVCIKIGHGDNSTQLRHVTLK